MQLGQLKAAGFPVHRYLWQLILIIWALSLWLLPMPALAAEAQPNRLPLTVELLQQRLKAPVNNEGVPTIDLRRFVIDLRPENASFRDQFYREVKAQLQRPGLPVGLDLSYSLIQGDFSGNQLGLRTPLYGQALSPIFTPTEQAQLNRDRRRLFQLNRLSRSLLSNELAIKDLQLMVFRGPLSLAQTRFLGRVDLSSTFFLGTVEAQGVDFTQAIDGSQTRFSQPVSFTGSLFEQGADFRSSIFFAKASFSQTNFGQTANFQGSEFQGTANFSRVVFQKNANFSRVQWQGNTDFAQSQWQNQAIFIRDQFNQAFFLTEADFQNIATFRESQFNRPVNLRGATVLDQLDFSDTQFAKTASLNIPELKFDPKTARILGDPGQISRVLSVPTLRGNEILLRNLVRNFRQLEQIGDANQIEYLAQKLRLRDIRQQLFSTNINRATLPQLAKIGFTPEQAATIAKVRTEQPFRSLTDLMSRNIIDLATYIKVRNRITAGELSSLWGEGLQILQGLGISLLLVLTRFGSSFWLIFGIGLVAIAYFGLLFWLVDRCRRRVPIPVWPEVTETFWIFSSFGLLSLSGLVMIFRASETPLQTLAFLGVLIVPVPLGLTGIIYQQGRYHDLMDVSYFVEDGSMRQFRLLIGRLPIVPRFPFFRERYEPILWHRRWSWLNYYDLSLINFLKFGFNDIRLRDQHLPGLVSSLLWYQWGLGLLYIGLLLWTLSRTIPGLNLFIYF
ncbi:MAG: pentapeptide repeat-containing protein [Aphanocapsa sp. GSE-SYN-MK-11-07L]|nr:pentapeptide repeat-containing protein [Aphanocapsa sp. GSE-SYN-MK-11-07L]